MHPRRVALLTLLAAVIVSGLPSVAEGGAPAAASTRLRVQLKWYHQAQFAGWYAAQDQGYFGEQGLVVGTEPGAPDRNPIDAVKDGSADVAVASMAQAVTASTGGRRFVNIAQIFQLADSELICNSSIARPSAEQLDGATVAVSPDRQPVVNAMFRAMFPNGSGTRIVPPQPDVTALVEGTADCIWGSAFNEYWRAADAGLSVFTVNPTDLGVVNIEDGLYVDERRLDDSTFRRQMVGMLIALERGWQFARTNPTSTVQLVRQHNPSLTISSQLRELESVLALLGNRFGYFDPGAYETSDQWGRPNLPAELRDGLWTHDVYTSARRALGDRPFVTPLTQHYLVLIRSTQWYKVLIWFGVFAAAMSGAILGHRQGYRVWGRVVLAALTALGGGVLRDVILGGNRYPIPLLHDTATLLVVLAAVVVVSLLTRFRSLDLLDRFAVNADVIGFAILAINGATIALISNASVIWAPICAALTVAGGGILSDIVARREHTQFKRDIYDEVAVVGTFALLALLWVANRHEHKPVLVLSSVLVVLGLLLAARFAVLRLDLHYPARGSFTARRAARAEAR